MKCKKCGFEMPEQAKFCMMCGAAAEKDVTRWADGNVEVAFEDFGSNEEYYFFCFHFKNHSGRNIVPILYSLTANGTSLVKDALMDVKTKQNQQDEVMQKKFFARSEIPHDSEAVCYLALPRTRCSFDLKTLSQLQVAPAYCLRGEDGYSYGSDQHNFPEQTVSL